MPGCSNYLLLVLVVSTVALSCDGARILALFPTPSRSHIISFQALTRELAARGHQVVVLSSFPQENPLANYTDIVLPSLEPYMQDLNLFNINKFQMLSMLFTMGSQICDIYMSDPELKSFIDAKDEHFDLILYGMMFADCFLGFAHKHKAPLIGMMPQGGSNYVLESIGNPNPFAHIPNHYLPYSQHMTFTERLVNTVVILANNWARRYLSLPQQDTVMRKYFSEYEPIPYVRDLEQNIRLLLLNAHWSISRNPRPYLPNVIDVGGMHITPAKKLPQDLQMFLDGAKDGAIYFSMGSNLKTSKMTPEVLDALITAFSKLKQRILWKSDLDTLPGLSSNVLIGKWMPQISILAHPNVRVFVTHGGLLSTQEAIFHGVPVVGIPIFGDQELNMNRAEEAGYGLLLAYKNVTAESLNWALDTVLNKQSYRSSAKRLSQLFRDQPSSPLEQAVYWTEYVIRHKGAPHLRSPTLDLAWYQYFLLDVIGFLSLAAVAIILITYYATRCITNKLGKQTKKTTCVDSLKKKE